MGVGFKKQTITSLVLVILLILPAPQKTAAMELGFTPGHVYGLWVRINDVLLQYSQMISQDELWLNRIRLMPAETVTGKLPRDVLVQAVAFGQLLPELFPGMKSGRQLLSDELLLHLKDNIGEIRSTQVYLYSTQVLFSLVEATMNYSTEDIVIGQYFKPPVLQSKMPSDVFAQIVLADQRLKAIMSLQQVRHDNQ